MNKINKRIRIYGIAALFLICSCNQVQRSISNTVVFDVGFENVNMHHGIVYDPTLGEEEIYFVKTEFGPHIKFYDLKGRFSDSISLSALEKKYGRIGHISLNSKDSLIVQFYSTSTVVGTTREGDVWLEVILYDEKDALGYTYKHFGSALPLSQWIDDEILLLSCWQPHDDDPAITEGFDSYFDLYSFCNQHRAKTSPLSKLSSLYDGKPTLTYGLQGFYGRVFNESRVYQDMIVRYTVLDHTLFYMNPYSRYLYILDRESLNMQDSVCVIPQELPIPEGIELTLESSEQDLFEEADKERKEKAQIVNLLYDQQKEKYYLFLKTGVDHSQIDELGYPFVIYVYDRRFNKTDEIDFSTDTYLPHSAVMTTWGIYMEIVDENKEYGKRVFDVFDL